MKHATCVIALLFLFSFAASAQSYCYNSPCQFSETGTVPQSETFVYTNSNFYFLEDPQPSSNGPFSAQWPSEIQDNQYQVDIPITFSPTSPGTYSGSVSATYIEELPNCCQPVTITLNINAQWGNPAPGFINPKYVILGVVYAPPGNSSTVSYGSNTVVGTSASVGSSFSNQNTFSVSVSGGGSIFGFTTTQTSTASTSYTEEQDTTSTTAVQQTTTDTQVYDGFLDPVNAVNHDYDKIVVWLNPILQFSTYTDVPYYATWTGYGFDLNDPTRPDLDVQTIQLGCINGDFYTIAEENPGNQYDQQVWSSCQSELGSTGRFARTWALTNVDGSSPALTPTLQNSSPPYDFCQQTGTDFYNICQADPFSDPNYTFTPPPGGSDTTSDGRFTACWNGACTSAIDFQPGQGYNHGQGYSTTETQSQTAKTTYSQTFAVEDQFKGSWLASLTVDMKNQNTLTWTHTFESTTNESRGQTASFNIVGPPEGYTGLTSVVPYQDNLYGTFMFWPVPQ